MNRPLIKTAPQAFLDPEGPITGVYPNGFVPPGASLPAATLTRCLKAPQDAYERALPTFAAVFERQRRERYYGALIKDFSGFDPFDDGTSDPAEPSYGHRFEKEGRS